MARTLRETDIKSALKLATSATKELVIAGVNGGEDFPGLLADYTWTGTRDYNMALIIVAFYAYCTKSENPDLKKFGFSALRDGSLSNKMFEALREGNGKKVKDCMKMPFMIALDTVLQTALPNGEDKRAKIIKSFINQAGKITPWKINGKDISDVIDRLIGSAAKEANKDMMQKEAIKNAPNAHHKMMKEEAYDKKLKKLIEERNEEFKNIKPEKKEAAKHAAANAVNVSKLRQQLERAVKSDDLKTVREIIKSNPHLVNSSIDSSGNTPLYYVVKKGNIEIVKLLLENGADPNTPDSAGETPLSLAVGYRHIEIVKLLLENGADPNIPDSKRRALLYQTVQYGFKEIAELLLTYGANPNAKGGSGFTPLHWAVQKNNPEMVDLLLNHGANINEKGISGETPLSFALTYRDIEIINLLLNHGADPNITDGQHRTPLYVATARITEEIVKLLLEHNANLDIEDKDGVAPLHWAVQKNNPEMVDLLLDHKANPNIKDKYGTAPLHLAGRDGNEEIVKLLLDHNANLNIEDEDKETPLLWAAKNGHTEIVELLLGKGASPNIKDKYGKTYKDLLPQDIIQLSDFPQDEFRNSFVRGEQRKCPICLDEFDADGLWCIFDCQNSKEFPFGHYFCTGCVQKVLDNDDVSARCPTCKRGLRERKK